MLGLRDTVTSASAGRRPSLRRRLTLWMMAITLVIQLSLGLVVLLYQDAAAENQARDRMMAQLVTTGAEIAERRFAVTNEVLKDMADKRARGSIFDAFALLLIGPDGSVVATSDPVAPDTFVAITRDRPLSHGRTVGRRSLPSWDNPVVGALALDSGAGEYVLWGIGEEDYVIPTMATTRKILLMTLPAGLLAAGIAAWLIAGLAVAPVKKLRQVAEALAPDRIEQDVELDIAPAEFEGLRRDLHEARQKLKDAFLAQDRFIANVSHELKTPVAVLMAEAQTLNTAGLSDEARAFVQSVNDEMRRLGRMVESFLTLTKIRGGKALADATACYVNDFVMDAVVSAAKMARQYKVALNAQVADGDLPPLTGDCELLRVMVDNLVRNAIRFTPEQSQVDVRVSCTPAEVMISVRDYGPGIPEHVREKIFDKFVQASPEIGRGRGFGLGLYIAQGIAELHGGRISCRNMPEGGCEFEVRLPIVPTEATAFFRDAEPSTIA